MGKGFEPLYIRYLYLWVCRRTHGRSATPPAVYFTLIENLYFFGNGFLSFLDYGSNISTTSKMITFLTLYCYLKYFSIHLLHYHSPFRHRIFLWFCEWKPELFPILSLLPFIPFDLLLRLLNSYVKLIQLKSSFLLLHTHSLSVGRMNRLIMQFTLVQIEDNIGVQ